MGRFFLFLGASANNLKAQEITKENNGRYRFDAI
jgi:hypothetical protein